MSAALWRARGERLGVAASAAVLVAVVSARGAQADDPARAAGGPPASRASASTSTSTTGTGVGTSAGGSAGAAALGGREATFSEYLTAVLRENLDLAAQRAGASATEAQLAVAKVFPDPQLSAGVGTLDLPGRGAPLTTSLGVSGTIELGGKRGARVEAAALDREAALAGLQDFLRTLRAQAASAFIDALAARLVLERKQRTQADLEKLVEVNALRLRAGDVGELAVVQSRIEAQRFRGEVLSAGADVRAADLALLTLLGPGALQAPLAPRGELQFLPRVFDLEPLAARARETRPDVVQKRRALEAAQARIALAGANRWVDLTPSLGWTHTGGGGAGQTATSAQESLSAGVSVPLPFSKVYRGELEAAQASSAQADAQLRAQSLRVEIELRTTLERFSASVEQVRLYLGGVLTDADRVLEAVRYNYTHGGATLLELLDAQRTANDVHLAYVQALQSHARALVAVEQAAGIWDLRF